MPSKTGQLSVTTAPINTGAARAAKKATDRESCFFIVTGGKNRPKPLSRSKLVSLTLFISDKEFSVKNDFRPGQPTVCVGLEAVYDRTFLFVLFRVDSWLNSALRSRHDVYRI